MKTYKMRLQNKPIYKISSKSNNRKVVKYTGKIFWGKISQGGGEIWGANLKKKCKVTNTIPKLIYVGSLIQIGQWKNVQKQGGWFLEKWEEFGGEGGILKKKK